VPFQPRWGNSVFILTSYQELAFPSTLLNSGDHIEPIAALHKLINPSPRTRGITAVYTFDFTNLTREVAIVPVSGFVVRLWTPAAYAIEGKSSKDYINIKSMAFRTNHVASLWEIADATLLMLSN